ncbi:FAD-dependent monooxygenase [Amycolatopsis sacchari]|uniref:FAD-dependent monooxygenase n=1 Tax=Amycolatopsis sacchari TaxID=115433 RepID=UPI003EC14F28
MGSDVTHRQAADLPLEPKERSLPAGAGTLFVTSVLIVGAGPAGLAAAIELGSRGIDCVLVDPRTEVSHKRPRGKTTHARTMEHFRRWGIAEEVRAVSPTPPETFHDVAFCTSLLGTEIHRFPNALGMFPARQEVMAETGLFVGQPLVEEVLRRKVATLPSVRTWYGDRATGIVSSDSAGADVQIVGAAGDLRRVRARYVIVADGPRSVLRESLGITLDGGPEGRRSVSVMFRSRSLWSRVEHDPAVTYWCINGAAAGSLWPYDPVGGLWVAATQDMRAASEPGEIVNALVGQPVEIEVVSIDVWQARRAMADTYRQGRFFLVGDAARQTPPWGGHGYNTCVLDAVDLAWKLAAVLDGWAPDALLDTYEIERRPVAGYVIDVSTKNMRVLSDDLMREGIDEQGASGDSARAAAAREIEAAKRAEFYSLGLVLGYNYGHSPTVLGPNAGQESRQPHDGTVYEPSYAPGSRLPHAWLPDGRSLFDLLGPGFTLLVRGKTPEASAIAEAAARRRIPLAVRTCSQLPEAYVLVRPDQHITWSSDRLDVSPDVMWDVATGHRRC